MLGATSIENENSGVSVRSALELLGAAYAVHPAFAEARIVEFGSGLRPAFPDNLPRIAIEQRARSRSTGFIATASCWRRRWRSSRSAMSSAA